MTRSYDVTVWSIKTRKNKAGKVTSYGVRWRVGDRPFYESFKVRAQADGYRSDLIAAQRHGEPFDTSSGLPVSMSRTDTDTSWFDLTCRYVDMKWADSAATARQTIAESLIRVAPVFTPQGQNRYSAKEIRSTLRQWAYNTERRESDEVPPEDKRIMAWCAQNFAPVRVVADPENLRALQRAVTRRLDGKPYAPAVARKTRSVLWNVLEYAVELGYLESNPLESVKWTAMPKGKRKVDSRAVPNPVQARTLLRVVKETPRSGERLEAFFGAMYFAALRPEEVSALRKENLSLPAPEWDEEKGHHVYGWGELHLGDAAPHVGARWTDGGQPRDKRHLKSRAAGEGRTVPCPPDLTELLWRHIDKYGFGEDGLLFRGEKGGPIPMITYTRTWRAARKAALSAEAQASPLARRPYDLRHAAVSTWLKATGDPVRVAAWAGHSVSVLHDTYAAFLDGGDETARRQVEAALGHGR